MAATCKPKTIDAYLESVSDDRRRALDDLRAKIRSIVPEAEECISYGIPAFRLHGAVVAGFHATAKGCSYFPFSGSTLEAVAQHIHSYDQTKSARHFSPARPLSRTLVQRLIKARLAEIEGRSRAKRAGSTRRRRE